MYIPSLRVGRGQANSRLWTPQLPAGLTYLFRDEFDRDTLDPSWVFSGTFDAGNTPPDIFQTGAFDSRKSHNEQMPSWLLIQNDDAVRYYLHYPLTIPTNLLVIARTRAWIDDASGLYSMEPGVMFCSAANPANDRIVTIPMIGSGVVTNFQYERWEGGVQTVIYSGNSNSNRATVRPEFSAIHKVGSTYHGWVSGRSNQWMYCGSSTFTPGAGPDAIGFYMLRHSNTPWLNQIFGADFIRAIETDVFPF